MAFLFFAISFVSSIIGAISGIGGGVIIKPVLDATGTMSVSTISFLSGCTVLSMSLVSLITGLKNKMTIDRTGIFLAIGGAVGGIAGKEIFSIIRVSFGNENMLGLTQALLLLVTTAGIFAYTLMKDKIATHHIKNAGLCLVIGFLLGVISAFLGIGGGPINIAVLYYFFDMDTKDAARNSLFIILCSQLSSLCSTFATGTVPQFDAFVLIMMLFAGVSGGFIGSAASRKLSAKHVEQIFMLLMLVIIGINIYNVIRFSTGI